jgi:hypothetical protein
MSEQKEKTKSWISFRVKPAEYDTIHGHFTKTTNRKLSEYCRKVLLQKPITVKFRNQTADDFLQEMLQLKKELNAIGHNYNQAVKKLHTINHHYEVRRWLSENEIIHQAFLQKTEHIYLAMNQIHKLWLSK